MMRTRRGYFSNQERTLGSWASFIKENFSGRLTEAQMNALVVHGARCTEHFETLKKNLMVESLTLLEILISGLTPSRPSSVVPSKPRTTQDLRVSTSRSWSCDRPPIMIQTRSGDTVDIRLVRGYESAMEGSKKRRMAKARGSRVSFHQETILSGGMQPSQGDCMVNPIVSPANNVNGDASGGFSVQASFGIDGIEALSFDLGIDFLT
uniref:Uncharacterized protein n=1 Tax=Arundo donax TaxID=35708 RepID=A0A0A9AMK9_ARUDO